RFFDRVQRYHEASANISLNGTRFSKLANKMKQYYQNGVIQKVSMFALRRLSKSTFQSFYDSHEYKTAQYMSGASDFGSSKTFKLFDLNDGEEESRRQGFEGFAKGQNNVVDIFSLWDWVMLANYFVQWLFHINV